MKINILGFHKYREDMLAARRSQYFKDTLKLTSKEIVKNGKLFYWFQQIMYILPKLIPSCVIKCTFVFNVSALNKNISFY